MKKDSPTVETGIDTIMFYCVLSDEEKQAIMCSLTKHPEKFYTETPDSEKVKSYRSDHYANEGVKIRVRKYKGNPWGLYLLVHPTLALGNKDRAALYQPAKKNYAELTSTVNQILREINAPCKTKNMYLYRADLTVNIAFEDKHYVDAYMSIIKKGYLPYRYQPDHFDPNDHKTKDPQAANENSFKEWCKSAAFFAYNKTEQLKMIDKFQESRIDSNILRLESQLRTRAIKRWLNTEDKKDHYRVLEELSGKADKIALWYLKHMRLVTGDHLRYQDAMAEIDSIQGKKTRERLRFLLEKTNTRNSSLATAIRKLKEKLTEEDSRCYENPEKVKARVSNKISNLLKAASDNGISLVTIPNKLAKGYGIKSLPSLETLLNGNGS